MIRPILNALLAATALMPAAAIAQDRQDDGKDRGGQHQSRGGGDKGDRGDNRGGDRGQQARPQRAPDQARVQPQSQARPQQQQVQGSQPRFLTREGKADYDRSRGTAQPITPNRVQSQQVGQQYGRQQAGQDRRDGGREIRNGDRNRGGDDRRPDFRDGQRNDRPDGNRSYGNRAGQQYGRGNGDWRGQQYRGRDQGQYNGQRYGDRGSWNRGWRNDNRYDYNRYRSSNRGAFHLPRYYAPYGWDYGYRRFSIGYSLSASLFGQNYWIDDPWYYRLPPADGPYRWVRYYNDALLVDLETGEVVDTVYDIFW